MAALLWAARKRRAATITLAGLATVELFWFAHSSLDSFPLSEATDPALKQFLAERPGDFRILNLAASNQALSGGWNDIWGEDPSIMRRYAEHVMPRLRAKFG